MFVKDFSKAVKAVKLKLGTDMDSGLLHRVNQNQGQGPISLRVMCFDRVYNLPLMKHFRHTSQEL